MARPSIGGAAAILAAASALLLPSPAFPAGPERLPTAADSVVERLKPKTLPLRPAVAVDEMNFYLYTPPRGTAVAAARSVILVSGEWGWTPLLQDTASSLAFQGRHVLGVDAMRYFPRLVDDAVRERDLAMLRGVLNEAAGKPKETPVLIAGFAYGAEMVPYVLNRAGVRGIDGALLIAPGRTGSAVFRASVQLRLPSPPEEEFSVAEQFNSLASIPVVVLEGEKDDKAAGRELFQFLHGSKKYVPIPGGDHQFHDTRQPYLDQVGIALRWLESETLMRPAGPGRVPSVSRVPGQPAGPGEVPAPPFVSGPGIGGHPAPNPTPKSPPNPPRPGATTTPAPPRATPTPAPPQATLGGSR